MLRSNYAKQADSQIDRHTDRPKYTRTPLPNIVQFIVYMFHINNIHCESISALMEINLLCVGVLCLIVMHQSVMRMLLLVAVVLFDDDGGGSARINSIYLH